MNDKPIIIEGGSFSDHRGIVFFNNLFDASEVKRFYFIENHSVDIIRGWQGHKIEKRWFMAVSGSFEIKVIKIDDWTKPSENLGCVGYRLYSKNLDVLYVPNGYITSLKSLDVSSKLMAMSNFLLGEIKDEYRYDYNYFQC